MKTKIMKFLLCIALLLCVLSVVACGSSADTDTDTDMDVAPPSEETTKYEDTGFVMGTVINITTYSGGDNIAPEIIDLLSEIETQYISWRGENSEIAAINENAQSNTPTEVSDKTREYIASALSIAKKSNGAFDMTIGGVSRLWDFDNAKNTIPADTDIKALLQNVGYDKIKLMGNTVEMEQNTSIDLGGIGKGIGCDEIEAYLDGKEDIKGLLVNIGGSSTLTYGEKDTGEPWKVAVLDPRDDAGFLGVLTLEGAHHVSTSGDYEKYFEEDGVRYFHILNPATGYPADSGLISTTIVANSGAISDGLSTACFVLGKEKAIELLAHYDAEGIFVDKDKNVYVTEGMKDRFKLLAEGYKLV
jgi:thiamine biosynthesis lipoprotein